MVFEALFMGKVSVLCATEIVGLNLDNDTLTDLLALPPSDIPSNVERLKRERARSVVIKRIRQQAASTPEWPQGRFAVGYADPAWADEFGVTDRAVENHYPVMTLNDIKALPVDEIMTSSAVLFLWVPPHMLPSGFEVLARWGFEYRTELVWDKMTPGMGQWVRNQHETLLIARRGDLPPPDESNRHPSVIESPRRAHSQRPDIFAELIELWYPDLPKVELFCRGPARPGWTAWGNEAEAAQ